MASASTEPVDPSKPGRFPVVLGDSILNRSNPREFLTGIRYNHKPTLSTPSAPTLAHISASNKQTSGNPQSFELNFSDGGGKYVYSGQRTTDSNQVVLIFDPVKQVFRLERVDSVFNMNLAATPSSNDPELLRKEFPHLEISKSSTSLNVDGPVTKKSGRKAADKKTVAKKPKKPINPTEKEKIPQPIADMAVPEPPPPELQEPPRESSSKKKSQDESDEDEDSDDDNILELVYPGGKIPERSFAVPTSKQTSVYPHDRFKEFLQNKNDGGDVDDVDDDDGFRFESDGVNDADNDEDGHSVVSEGVKLPSPHIRPENQWAQLDPSEEDEEVDLEAEMVAALEEEAEEEAPEEDSEDISEEE